MQFLKGLTNLFLRPVWYEANRKIQECVEYKYTSIEFSPQTIYPRTKTTGNKLLFMICDFNIYQRSEDMCDYMLDKLPDLSPIPNLRELCISDHMIETIVSLPIHLENFYCDRNCLKRLPTLPVTLIILSCSENELEQLPTLPPNLRSLGCDNNLLTELPILPNSLGSLSCAHNEITKLPKLPENLSHITCINNKLTQLPKIPLSVTILNSCWGNEYLYLDTDVCIRFQRKQGPNYNMIFSRIKKVYQSKKRIERLKFCIKLHEQMDEFRYRPGNGGYLELKTRNKRKFIDLY